MKDINGVLRSVKEDNRVWMVQGTLNFRKVIRTDAGKYQCIVRNSIGERRIESALFVSGTYFDLIQNKGRSMSFCVLNFIIPQ